MQTRLKLIQTGYLLSMSLLLTSVFYFFASNWQGLDRLTKVGLSIALVLFLYALHLIMSTKLSRHYFLSDWMLIAASLAFGLALALNGQTYNSHADSYLLFFVWFIPVFLLALITKYVPFYMLSYILLHLTIYFFLTPSSYFTDWTETQLIWILFGVMFLNAVIFHFSKSSLINSKTLKYTSFTMFYSVLFFLTLMSEQPIYIMLTNGLLIILLVSGMYYFYKVRPNRILVTVQGVIATIYLLNKSISWINDYYGEWILLLFLLLAVALITLSVKTVQYMNKNRNKESEWIQSLFIVIVTMVATIFATVSILGLFFLIFPEGSVAALFFFSLGAFVIPSLFLNWSYQVKYPLITTGFLTAIGTGVFADSLLYKLILFILLSLSIYRVNSRGLNVFLYLLLNVVFITIIADSLQLHGIILSIFIVNVLYYFIQTKERATHYSAWIISLFSFISLTVIQMPQWQSLLYNIFFFIIITAALFICKKKGKKIEWITSFVFWFLFIGYKYYELMWKLIHKSILFLLLGLIFLIVTYYCDKKFAIFQKDRPRLSYKSALLLSIILLQVGFLSYQSTMNELLLRNGTLVKLELAPVDPRSLLQGDYVILRYDITSIPKTATYSAWNEKVKVVLRENDEGIYEYAGYMQSKGQWNRPYEKQSGDVIINGKRNGPNEVIYGIESFFVPEGEGIDLQNKAKYAYIRVSQSGNAMIEAIE